MELTYITDFFLALAVCNSVVVSSPSQPRHTVPIILTAEPEVSTVDQMGFKWESLFSFLQVPVSQTPLKQMFQRLSLPPFSVISTPQIRGSPRSFTSRLFSLGRTDSYTFSTPSTPSNSNAGGGPGHDRDIQASVLRQQLNLSCAVGDLGQIDRKDTEMSLEGAEEETVDPSREVDSDNELRYEAESPDEAALVHAAHAYSCTLRGRSADRLLVDLPGFSSLDVQLLHILPFDSNRKRMSVVVRHPLTGQVVVYTKGADSVIMGLSENPKGKYFG